MEKVNINDISTLPAKGIDKDATEDKTKELLKELETLQNILFAQAKYSLLIVLQGMDASGKDGAIKKVFSGLNPMGCSVSAYKKPTEEEMAHDFLWRIHKQVPQKGMIKIFNRSHYEDVLIQRVHEWINIETVKMRFRHINHFEELLVNSGTKVIKFYLHVSQNEQIERLTERLHDPEKMWKYNPNDLVESKRWGDYMDAYNDVFNYCSPTLPWVIVPADKNWYKEYIIADKIVKTLRDMKLEFPKRVNL